MDKKMIAVFVLLCVVMAGIAGASYSSRQQYYMNQMDKVCAYTGYESLGLIDSYEISRANGTDYDREAIKEVLCERAGIPSESHVDMLKVMDCEEKLSIWHLSVYSSELDRRQGKSRQDFLYGEIY